MIDTKQAYLEKLQGKMAEMKAEIDKLKAKASQSKADIKMEIDKQVGNLEARRSELDDKIQQLRQAGEGAWEDIKGGVQRAWEEFGEAVKSATAKFK